MVLVTHHVERFTRVHALSDPREGTVVAAGLPTGHPDVGQPVRAFGKSIALDDIDGRYFARRSRSRAAHRRRL